MLDKRLTTKLFRGIYRYKIVLVCAGSSYFRNKELHAVLDSLNNADVSTHRSTPIKSIEDKNYAIKLALELSNMTDFELRVESPWLSVYSNNKKAIDKLINLNPDKVKYICEPTSKNLSADTVIMPKVNYEFRVTLGKTIQEHSSFIDWAEQNKKLKLTNSCKRELARSRSWGGTHFYVTGNNNLLLAKMHLGGSISKVERIIKA